MGFEKLLESRLKKGTEKLQGLCIKIWCISFTGLPDRILLFPGGVLYFVEMKQPKGTASTRQLFVHGLLAKLGFPVQVLYTREAIDYFLIVVQKRLQQTNINS